MRVAGSAILLAVAVAAAAQAPVRPAPAPARYDILDGHLEAIAANGDGNVLPDVPVHTRFVTAGHIRYRIDHVDTQTIAGQTFAAHDFATPQPPGGACPAQPAPDLGGVWEARRGAALPDIAVDGVAITGRAKLVWVCHPMFVPRPEGIVGGISVREAHLATPWQAELYSTAIYEKQDFAEDAHLVRAHNADAEYLGDRQAYEYRHHCGAVLIATDWVVTAQHCIEDADGRIDPGYVMKWRRIRLGTQDLVQGGATYAITRVVLHPRFDAAHYRNDIALLRIVADKDTLGIVDPELIAPIRIAGTHRDDPAPAGWPSLTALGWGTQTAHGDDDPTHLDDQGHLTHDARVLRMVTLNYVAPAVCARDPHYAGVVRPGVICAGYAPGGRDSCQGDSGGPLVALPADGGHPVVVAVVSGGYGCALPGTPGIYTDLAYNLPWIRATVGAAVLVP